MHKAIQEQGCNVAVDGSLYEKNPGYTEKMHQGLIAIIGEDGKKIKSSHAEDGSGVGCTIIGAMTKARKDAGTFVNY